MTPNVIFVPCKCRCKYPHFEIKATQDIFPNDILTPPMEANSITQPTLLCQFDGSCHSSASVGGAGYGIFLVYPSNIQLLLWRSIGLHNCRDNVSAEVRARRLLVDEIVDLGKHALQQLAIFDREIIVQGDILPVIKYLSFAGRLRRHDLLEDLEHIQRKSSFCHMSTGEHFQGRPIVLLMTLLDKQALSC